MDTIRSMLQEAVGATGAGSGTGATGGGNGADGGPQELNPDAAVLKDSLFDNLLGANCHGDEQEGQPNVSYEIGSRAEPSAEMQSLSKIYSYHPSYSGEGNDPESLGLSPLRSGSVARPNAGAAELPSPIATNETNHDISTIASPSLGSDSDEPSSSILMDSSEGRSEGDLTYRIPLETPSWAKDGNLRQVPTPSTFRSFRAEGLDMEAILHGSGGGLADDEERDVLGREEEEEEADVEEVDAKRRAEAFADNDGEFPSLDEEEIQEEAGEEEGVGAAGTNEEVDSPPAEQKRAASALTIPAAAAAAATPLTQTQIDQNEEDLERGILLSEREETERKAMEAQYEENLHNTLLASTREETANDDRELPAPDDGEIQEEAAEEGVGAAGANEEVDSPPAEANDATAANASSALDNFDMQPTQLALNLASNADWWLGATFYRERMTIYGVNARLNKRLLAEGKSGINACNIRLQTKPMGLYLSYARRKTGDHGSNPVDVLLETGHHSLLLDVTQCAHRGDVRNHEIPGGANGDNALIVNPRDVQTDSDSVRTAFYSFCGADSAFNCLMVNHSDLALAPFGGEVDVGVYLRKLICDEFGKLVSFDNAIKVISETAGIPFDLARCNARRLPGIEVSGPSGKLEFLLTLSAQEPERMFMLQCIDKHGSSSHYISLVAGIIRDNCASTGGKFDAREYADEFLSGVRKAAEILVCPTKKQKKKKAPVESKDDANKKARIQ